MDWFDAHIDHHARKWVEKRGAEIARLLCKPQHIGECYATRELREKYGGVPPSNVVELSRR